MKRVFIGIVFTLLAVISWSTTVKADLNPTVYLNGNQLYFDVPTQIVNGRLMVPMRTIFEALGANIIWDSSTQTIWASKDKIHLRMIIGKTYYFENEIKNYSLDVPPQIINGRTMVPLRFVSECMKCKVNYDGTQNTVTIDSGDRTNTGLNEIEAPLENNKVPFEYGNSPGNVSNGGYAALKDNWIYYSNTSDSGHLYKIKTDGTGKMKLTDESSTYINVVGDWIIYKESTINSQKLMKIKTDGSAKTMIYVENPDYINVVGDWVYYANIRDDEKIYRIRSDGTGRTRLTEDATDYMNVVGEWIYYNSLSDGKLYKIKTDGTGRTNLSTDSTMCLNVIGDWIYYCNYHLAGKSKLYKTKADGSGYREEIGDGYLWNINVVGDWIYYSNDSDNSKLYKMKTDGSNKTKLNNDVSMKINVVGDWIYYCTHYDNNTFYRIRTDGSERQPVQ